MKHWCLTFCLVIGSLFGSVGMGFALPPCPLSPSDNLNFAGKHWKNCHGSLTLTDELKVIGEFKNGQIDGQALLLTFEQDGFFPRTVDIYSGGFKSNRRHGEAVRIYMGFPKEVHIKIQRWKNDEVISVDEQVIIEGSHQACDHFSDEPWNSCVGIYKDENGGKYAGEWRNNKPSGKGIFINPSGFWYAGEWKNGEENGYGKRVLPNGDIYHGNFLDGEIDKKNVTYIWSSSEAYFGELKDEKPNGQGIRNFFLSGNTYIGQFKLGHEHGYGTRYYENGHIYSGYWKNSYKHGQGMLFSDSKIVAGFWTYDEEPQTQKIIKSLLPACPRFEGIRILGYMDIPLFGMRVQIIEPQVGDEIWTNCFGFQSFDDGGTYAGEWQESQFDGQGVFTNPVGSQYVGTWKGGAENGLGSLTLPNGTKYEGQFKNSKFDGPGTLTLLDGGDFADRDEYVGHFKEDNFHGEGTYTVYLNDEVESVLEGVWANGEFQNAADTSPPILTEVPTEQGEFISASSGSGFAVSKDGYIITNFHVIEGCQKIVVHSKNQDVLTRIITNDLQNDLALLKGDFSPSSVFPLSSAQPELLQDVYVAGYPFGQEISTSVKVTKGIISSLTGIGNNFSNIQIDAALQPGNSGGPILDEKGNLVGVAVAKLDLEYIIENYGVVPEGTNFGIKSSVVKNILDSYEVDSPAANQDEISKSELGEMISNGTYYISCWMTAAQIEKMQSEKVMFSNLK